MSFPLNAIVSADDLMSKHVTCMSSWLWVFDLPSPVQPPSILLSDIVLSSFHRYVCIVYTHRHALCAA